LRHVCQDYPVNTTKVGEITGNYADNLHKSGWSLGWVSAMIPNAEQSRLWREWLRKAFYRARRRNPDSISETAIREFG
jgi:hypothetical protein